MVEKGIDHLVLGCTHYPHLIPLLKEILPVHVRIIDCGAAVASQTYRVLEKNGLLASDHGTPSHHFYTNSDTGLLAPFLPAATPNLVIAFKDF
jgi:glutamate racemase